MRKAPLLLLKLVALQYFLGFTTTKAIRVQEKEEAGVPVSTTMSPPEGNTTFLGGTSWCVARPDSSSSDLHDALDWACGLGKADCSMIQPGGPCFMPNTVISHASYAFNSYYQENGNSDVACYFSGTAVLTKNNPSYERCVFATSELPQIFYKMIHLNKSIIRCVICTETHHPPVFSKCCITRSQSWCAQGGGIKSVRSSSTSLSQYMEASIWWKIGYLVLLLSCFGRR
ncbi:hypothetical protein OROHE_025422 [Orobanche hederae]